MTFRIVRRIAFLTALFVGALSFLGRTAASADDRTEGLIQTVTYAQYLSAIADVEALVDQQRGNLESKKQLRDVMNQLQFELSGAKDLDGRSPRARLLRSGPAGSEALRRSTWPRSLEFVRLRGHE